MEGPPLKRIKTGFSDEYVDVYHGTMTDQSREIDFTSSKTKILVGRGPDEKRAFMVHQDILCRHSTFFKAAYSERWKRTSKNIELRSEEPDIFNLYLNCVYAGQVPTWIKDEDDDNFVSLTKMYILADKLGDLYTANLIIDRIAVSCDERNDLPGKADVLLCYANSTETSPLRRLYSDLYLDNTDRDIDPEKFPAEFWRDVALGSRKQKTRDVGHVRKLDKSSKPPCHYHQHDEDGEETCEATREDVWRGVESAYFDSAL